jgi:hypothetical protein
MDFNELSHINECFHRTRNELQLIRRQKKDRMSGSRQYEMLTRQEMLLEELLKERYEFLPCSIDIYKDYIATQYEVAVNVPDTPASVLGAPRFEVLTTDAREAPVTKEE